jgi:diguanylate cyclase (GGDEF)-like protein/PAS domain S-box-containing protein
MAVDSSRDRSPDIGVLKSDRYFELSRDLMVTSSFDGYFKSVNPAVAHILGWSAEQFLARPFMEMVHPDDRASTLLEVAKLGEGQVTFHFLNRFLTHDGGYRWLDWNAIVPPDEQLMYASARDVTEQKLAEAALAASESATRQILESAQDAFVAIDARGIVTDWSPKAQVAFGWSHDEALGRDLADLIVPAADRAAHRNGLQRLAAGGEPHLVGGRRELVAQHRDGHRFPVEVTVASVQTDTGTAFNAFLRDISDRRRAEDEILRARAVSERLLRAQGAISRVFAEAQTSDEAMRRLLAALCQAMGWQLGAWWSHDPASDTLRCRSVWRAEPELAQFERVTLELELARGVALPGRAWAGGEPAWTADLAADPSFPRAEVAAGAGLHASVCVPVVVDGEFCDAVEFFSSAAGEPDHETRRILGTIGEQIGGFMSVLNERAKLIEKLQRLALTDELTGFANRRAWQENLERELARARRDRQPLCVAMLDLDYFKNYNDARGHLAGDELLRELARAWRTQLRASDILARYGGEEFAIAIPATSVQAAAAVLERVRAAVPQGQTCSAGLAAFDGAESATDLVGRADAALYEAKLQGRDRTVIARDAQPA